MIIRARATGGARGVYNSVKHISMFIDFINNNYVIGGILINCTTVCMAIIRNAVAWMYVDI